MLPFCCIMCCIISCNQGFSLRVLEGSKIDRIDRNLKLVG